MSILTRFGRILIPLTLLASAAAASAQSAPPPTPVPFQQALQKAADDLFGKAALTDQQVDLVIDPLIDAASGSQSTATRSMQQTLIEIVRKSYPRFTVRSFDSGWLARKPVVLVGTFTAVNNNGATDGARDAYRICLTLADLKSNSVVSKGVARARIEGVDTTPTLYYRDAPLWTKDQATDVYIKTCQGTKLGETIDPAYVERLTANAFVNDGILAYEAQRFREALAYYRAARTLPGGEQHRVRIGTYLAASKLARRDDMVDAFGDLIDYGLGANQLMVKLLFKPGTTQFIDDPGITEPYPMWLSQIATRARQKGACLEVVGHTSRTGPPQVNERLSALRAQFVMDLLLTGMPEDRTRMIASGRGFKENLIGTGKDDGSDALDRRVEFKVIGC
ncbi:OmpA family protein [Bosea vestrisii]|uniref:OmpA family protein n=1 Tax=Bosea vestrisii TaxID=151416 RepID=UPI0024DFAEC5|nr:OmpA family protein [Bosea vestrisii]WID98961.1 OmpA family protein [Bosea vestrisii]